MNTARPGRAGRWSRRRDRCADDRGSMPLALLLTLVGVTLSGLLVSMVVTQTTSTATANSRATSVHAAQAGLDAGVAQIRAAFVDGVRHRGARVGSLAKLPCGTLPIAFAGRGRYQVRIDYLTADPKDETDATLPGFFVRHRLPCAAGLTTLPGYALLRSTGTMRPDGAIDAGPHRSLRGTYVFRTDNENSAGGVIRVYLEDHLCLDAGAEMKDTVTAQPCDPTLPQQQFAYNKDLTLSLVKSKSTALPLGMCIDTGPVPFTGPDDRPVTLASCVDPAPARQRWSYSDWAALRGTAPDNKAMADFCLRLPTATAGTVVQVGLTGCSDYYNSNTTFTPDAAVGAGAAGLDSGQLVNYFEFGRCADVTKVDITREYMQAWPCKQAPDGKLLWNQLWKVPMPTGTRTEATGPITVTPCKTGDVCAKVYCLKRPSQPNAYSTMVECDPADPALADELLWTYSRDAQDYDASYRISDRAKKDCLSVVDPNDKNPDYRDGDDNEDNFPNISKLLLKPCDASTMQKWNAPARVTEAQPLKDISER